MLNAKRLTSLAIIGALSASAADVANAKSAVQWTRITNTCKSALGAIVDNKSDFSKCSGAGVLFQDLVSNSAVDSSADLIPVFEKYLQDGLCKTDACPPQVTNGFATNIASACSVDLQKGNIIALAAHGTMLNYAAARRTVCLYDSGAKGNGTAYCPAGLLNNIKTSGIPINYDSIQKVLQDPMTSLKSLKSWTYCSPCGKGMTSGLVNVLNNIDGSWGSAVSNLMNGYCGAGFADGSTPSQLGDGTKTTTTGQTLPTSGKSGPASGSGSSAGGLGSGDGTQTPDGSSTGFKLSQPIFTTASLLLAFGVVLSLAM